MRNHLKIVEGILERKLGILKRKNLRHVWPYEALQFTPWLTENLQVLDDVLGMDMEFVEREAKVGTFVVDILAKDIGSDELVVIENQFGITDHDHLGKLLTYAAGFDDFAVVWISEEIRDEHRQTLDWLNQRTDEETLFFGVKLELLQIADSAPAFSLKPIVFPNDWQKKTHKKISAAISPRAEAYQELIDRLRIYHGFTGAKKAQPTNWYAFASGYSSISYGVTFRQGGKACVELWIDFPETELNKELFDRIYMQREKAEDKLGSDLEWERLNESKSSRVAFRREGSISDNEDTLEDIQDWMFRNLLVFKETFGPIIEDELPNSLSR